VERRLAVPAGKYVVFAKADIGTNATGGYPQAGGALRLRFASHSDVAYAAIKPDSGDNIENVSLILAAETEGQLTPGSNSLTLTRPESPSTRYESSRCKLTSSPHMARRVRSTKWTRLPNKIRQPH
jgi:hypothetical protein